LAAFERESIWGPTHIAPLFTEVAARGCAACHRFARAPRRLATQTENLIDDRPSDRLSRDAWTLSNHPHLDVWQDVHQRQRELTNINRFKVLTRQHNDFLGRLHRNLSTGLSYAESAQHRVHIFSCEAAHSLLVYRGHN
jgi:hypothetical protein